MYNIIENDIVVNLIVGFFYSAIIGIIILILNHYMDKKKSLKNLLIDLTRLTFILHTINEPIDRISKLNGAEYRKYFGNVLDEKEIILEEVKTVNELILYDEIPHLPKINDYLIDEFNNSVDKSLANGNKDFKEMSKQTKDIKTKYLIENNAFLLSYEVINRRILRLNHILDYYRSLTFELIRFVKIDLNIENIATKNKFRIFKYTIDTLIDECIELRKLLELLENTVFRNRKDLMEEIKSNEKLLSRISKGLCVVIIIFLVLLIVA